MNSKKNQVNFHLWIPDIFQFKGGIQVYLAFVLTTLQEINPEANYKVFLKNDTHEIKLPDFDFLGEIEFQFFGKLSGFLRTLIFAIRIFILGLLEKPNLILCCHANFSPVAYYLKKITGVSYWTFIYGAEVWNITNPLIQKGLNYSDRIISIGTYTNTRLLENQNFTKRQIDLLFCTFPSHKFIIDSKPQYLLQKYHLLPDQSIILTVARLAKAQGNKGYDKIIQSLPQIIQTFPNIHYIIVGKGDDSLRIEQLIKNLNLEQYVTLAGFIPDEELNHYYNLCDVFAMPSKQEGFGIVYLEALACGKPVLGGNQDGAVDALCNGELGALVDPDNLDEIAETLIKILQGNYPNPIMYQPEALRQKVISTFGFENFKHNLENYINQFLVN